MADRLVNGQQACWFDGAGFGMFIHWDHASQQGLEISWPMVGGVWSLPYGQSVTPAQYRSSADTFNPQTWDAADLARRARAAGLKIGLYYSLSDWHHPDYPPLNEADLPYLLDTLPQPTPDQADRYRAYLMGQLRELMTEYGRIDIAWFDGRWGWGA